MFGNQFWHLMFLSCREVAFLLYLPWWPLILQEWFIHHIGINPYEVGTSFVRISRVNLMLNLNVWNRLARKKSKPAKHWKKGRMGNRDYGIQFIIIFVLRSSSICYFKFQYWHWIWLSHPLGSCRWVMMKILECRASFTEKVQVRVCKKSLCHFCYNQHYLSSSEFPLKTKCSLHELPFAATRTLWYDIIYFDHSARISDCNIAFDHSAAMHWHPSPTHVELLFVRWTNKVSLVHPISKKLMLLLVFKNVFDAMPFASVLRDEVDFYNRSKSSNLSLYFCTVLRTLEESTHVT